jgi:hypothetical protein
MSPPGILPAVEPSAPIQIPVEQIPGTLVPGRGFAGNETPALGALSPLTQFGLALMGGDTGGTTDPAQLALRLALMKHRHRGQIRSA